MKILSKYRFSRFKKIEEIFKTLSRKESWGKRFALSEILKAWNEIVGSDISRIAKPSLLKGKTIVVEVDDNIWLAQLQSESEELREKLNFSLGQKKVKEIRFVLSNKPIETLDLPDHKNEAEKKYEPEPISEKDEDAVNKLIDNFNDPEFKEIAEKLLTKIKKVK